MNVSISRVFIASVAGQHQRSGSGWLSFAALSGAFSKEIREKRFYTTFFSIVSILSIFVGLASGSISFFIAAIGFAGIAINLHKSLLKKAKTEEIENKQEEIENTSILKEFSDCFPTLDTNRFSNKFNLSEIKRPNDPVIRSDYTFYVNNIGYSEGAIPSVDVTGKAALVEFTVFNHTNSNQSFSIPILYLIDENLNEYSKSSFSSAVSRGREGLAESDNLRPNQEGAFYVLFDINLDSEGIMLEYRPLLGRKNLISLAM